MNSSREEISKILDGFGQKSIVADAQPSFLWGKIINKRKNVKIQILPSANEQLQDLFRISRYVIVQ